VRHCFAPALVVGGVRDVAVTWDGYIDEAALTTLLMLLMLELLCVIAVLLIFFSLCTSCKTKPASSRVEGSDRWFKLLPIPFSHYLQNFQRCKY